MTHPFHLAHQTFIRVSLNCHKPGKMLAISHWCCSSSQELLNWHHSYSCKPVHFTLIPIPQTCFSQWGDPGWTPAWTGKWFGCLVQAEFSYSIWWQSKYLQKPCRGSGGASAASSQWNIWSVCAAQRTQALRLSCSFITSDTVVKIWG